MFFKPRTPEQIEKRRRFWQRARRRLFFALAIAFVAHSGLNIYASVLLNRELATIREKGEPLQFAELAPPAVPAAQNAALVYKQATNSLHFSPEEKVAFRTRSDNRTPQMKRAMEAALAKNQKALDLTRRAAAMAQCRFPLDYGTDNPTGLFFPHYAEMRELAQLLGDQANLEAKNGATKSALRDVRALFGISHHLSNEPVLIGFLVAHAIDVIANQALAQVLESEPLTAAEAQAFQASLPQNDWNRAFRRALMGERNWGIFAFERLRQPSGADFAREVSPDLLGGEDSESGSFSWVIYPLLLLWRPMLKLDEVESLRLWRQRLDSPAFQQVPQPVGFEQALDRAVQDAPRYALLTRLFFPVFGRASDNRDFAEVRRRQREVALALAVYRTTRGHYPAQLGEVVGLWGKPLPLDLYSDKPFIYRREGKRFMLYSVGVNRTDDGGQSNYSGGNAIPIDADDVAWRNSSN